MNKSIRAVARGKFKTSTWYGNECYVSYPFINLITLLDEANVLETRRENPQVLCPSETVVRFDNEKSGREDVVTAKGAVKRKAKIVISMEMKVRENVRVIIVVRDSAEPY